MKQKVKLLLLTGCLIYLICFPMLKFGSFLAYARGIYVKTFLIAFLWQLKCD